MISFHIETLRTIFSIFFLACVLYDNIYWIFLYVQFKFTKQPLVKQLDYNGNGNINVDTDTCVVCESKYEDKYLELFRKGKRAFHFDENETIVFEQKKSALLESFMETYRDKLEENRKKQQIFKELIHSDDDYCHICDTDVCYNEIKHSESDLLYELDDLTKKEMELIQEYESPKSIDHWNKQAEELSRKYVINERLDKLKNCFVIEKTPLGNVLMVYNNTRSSFEFYSDNTIPYRYLEPVSRKYVMMFHCWPIYFDMEEELKLSKDKLDEKENNEKEKAEKKKQNEEENKKIHIGIETKKNVFAKFKSYNKESGTGHVNMSAPPKNSIPNNTPTSNNEKVLLKENTNRYSYQGKLSNFRFLKKMDRKVTDKKYGMTFADFKKLQENKQTE
jgi:hypothetical protein